jgi:5-methylcytosine-specific restriction endonuclease McrA
MLDDPNVVADILRRLRQLNPETPLPYRLTSSRLKASARAKKWWEAHPDKRKLVVAKYEARNPELKQTRKARYRGRLLNAEGTFTRKEWEARKAQFGNRCAYCGRKAKRLTPDHYMPLSKGGTNSIDNIIPSCERCNRRKWNIDPSKFKFPHRTQMIFAQLQAKTDDSILNE